MKHVDKHFLSYFASVLILLIQRDVQVLLVRAHWLMKVSKACWVCPSEQKR